MTRLEEDSIVIALCMLGDVFFRKTGRTENRATLPAGQNDLPLIRHRILLESQASDTIVINTVCVCVCVFSSHSFWTSSSLDVPAGVTQEEGHTGFLIHLLSAVHALIFLARRRIQPFLSLVDREVEFCVLTI